MQNSPCRFCGCLADCLLGVDMPPSSENLPSVEPTDSIRRAPTATSAGAARNVAASVASSSSTCIAIAKDDCSDNVSTSTSASCVDMAHSAKLHG